MVDGHPALIVIDAARMFLARSGGLDPADRYHFEGHAPIAGALGGRMAVWNRTALAYLTARMESLAAGRA